jgi:glycosyltransferase involved in cell wall biosynthesis
MRIAWFSPLPPVRSGVADYSADLLTALNRDFDIDCFVDAPSHADRTCNAHEFSWRHRRAPYDLTVYQLGNAPCHDYMWAYLATHPGLVVLHDARLHHARARALLSRGRAADYREEFRFDHPDAVQDFVEYAVEGLSGSVYSLWSMSRVAVATARVVAVHNARVAADLREQYPSACIETIRMGVPSSIARPETAAAVRRTLSIPDDAIVCAAFGKMTPEKRIGPILAAFRDVAAVHSKLYLLLIGDAGDQPGWAEGTPPLDRVRATGHVSDEAIAAYLTASDICLCLRWPTALETSASWLRCLAANRATVITDLAHLVDTPAVDPRDRLDFHGGAPIAVRIDLLDEERSLRLALEWLAADEPARRTLAQHGFDYWAEHHTIGVMADDYRRVLRESASHTAPRPDGLPAHLTEDYTGTARNLAQRFGIDLDVLGPLPQARGRAADQSSL